MAYVKMVNDKFPNPRQTFEDKSSTEGTQNLFTVRSTRLDGGGLVNSRDSAIRSGWNLIYRFSHG